VKHSKRRELKTAYGGTAGLSVIYGSAVTWFYSFPNMKQKKISLEKFACANSYCLLERFSIAAQKKKRSHFYDTYTI